MKTNLKAIFMAAGMLCPFFSLVAQDKSQKIDSLMNGFYEAKKYNGSILVAEQGTVLYKQGFGIADAVTSLPNQPGTVFYIASITKPFTSLLIMQLVEAGKIKIDNTLQDYFPGLKNDALSKVNIHQLLSHTSGIPDFVGANIVSENEMTTSWFTDQLNNITPESVPGTAFKYANSTYVILAHIIEKSSGKTYAEHLKASIFDKCGMSQSGSLVTGSIPKGIAKGYVLKDDKLTGVAPFNPAIFKGAGSIYSTVEDLFKFDQALYTGQLISDKYRDMMYNSIGIYGYGWFIRQFPGIGKVVYHEGGIPGYTSTLFRPIEKKYCVILLSNNASGDVYKQEIIRQVIGILNDK